ncbi:MAG: hypothetical protein WCX97_04050 [Candidatus Magasanikbacteria bacterium]
MKKILIVILFIIVIFWVNNYFNKSKNNNQTTENQLQGSFETQFEYISKEDGFTINMFIPPEITKTEVGIAGLLAINDYAFRKDGIVYGVHVAKLIDSKKIISNESQIAWLKGSVDSRIKSVGNAEILEDKYLNFKNVNARAWKFKGTDPAANEILTRNGITFIINGTPYEIYQIYGENVNVPEYYWESYKNSFKPL